MCDELTVEAAPEKLALLAQKRREVAEMKRRIAEHEAQLKATEEGD